MASHKERRDDEELGIDKVNSHLTSLGEKVANNKKIIFWIVGIILVCGAFTMSYLFIYRNPHMQEAFEAYNQVQTQAPNDSVAAEQYKAVADKYKGDTAGKLAALSAGEALYNQGNYADAVEYLKRFSSDDEVLNANVEVLIGDCYVNLQQYQEALEYYGRAVRAANNNPQIVPRVYLKEANVYDEMKNYEKALECYQLIKTGYPEFQLGNGIEIDAYIAREQARLGQLQ